MTQAKDAFIESEHPRGQPQNAGEFVKKGEKTGKSVKESPRSIGKEGFANGRNESGTRIAGRILARGRRIDKNNNGKLQLNAGTGGQVSEGSGRAVEFLQTTPEKFHAAISEATKNNDFGAAVHVYSPEEYKDAKLYLTDNGKAGFALKGDDIVSVFKSPDSKVKKFANAALNEAVKLGGRRLDCFDTILPEIYSQNHFKAVARLNWNDEYAPEDWNYERMKPFHDGRPDVVFMVYDPESKGLYKPGEGKRVTDYGEGIRQQSRFLAHERSRVGADSFVESEHPRGQPENAGEFVKKGEAVKGSKKPSGRKMAERWRIIQHALHNSPKFPEKLEKDVPTQLEKKHSNAQLEEMFEERREMLNYLREFQQHQMRQKDLEQVFSGSKYKRKLIIKQAEKYSYQVYHEHINENGLKMLREFSQEDYEVLHEHFYDRKEIRNSIADKINHHATLLPKIIVSHASELASEYKDAALAAKDLLTGNKPNHERMKALKEVATTTVLVSAMLAVGGDLSVKSFATLEIATLFSHEFINHTILEHLAKFSAGLARFLLKVGGVIKGDAKEAVEITKEEIRHLQDFLKELSDTVKNYKITTNQYIKAVYEMRTGKKAEDVKLANDPPVSEAQRKAMFAAASGHSTLGIPKSVGEEFVDKDKGGKLPKKAKDMQTEDWSGLVRGLLKFFMEEAREDAHNKDDNGNDQQLTTQANSAIPAAGVMLMTPDYKILFGRRRNKAANGDWAFPAGHVEGGETAEEAAKRETREETGYGRFYNEMPLLDRREVNGVDFSTYLQGVQEPFDPEPNEEFSEFVWAYPDEAPEPLHPGVKQTLSKYLDDDDEGDDMVKRSRDEENPHGKLSKETREEVDSTKHREDMPEDAFLGPHRSYPVKEKRDGQWKYTKDLLEAAERRAVSQNRKDIASRAHSLLEKNFGIGKDESFEKLEHSLAHRKGVTNAKSLAAWIGRKNGKIPGHDAGSSSLRHVAKIMCRR